MACTVESLTRWAGFHRWPDATGTRAYLAAPHRHLFHIRAEVSVEGTDRAVEFHDLGADVVDVLMDIGQPVDDDPSLWDFDTRSCEAIAQQVGEGLAERDYALVKVSVSEDDEYTATWRP